LTARNYRKEEK